ncbi:MAG: hypothetical protein GY913_12845 [Proteobacteria bacterium]|nr:hypothetical protein [Pseudomonadota bacterium]MCP4917794.1 hypothetical protein [Pseudomonadota bacterium]
MDLDKLNITDLMTLKEAMALGRQGEARAMLRERGVGQWSDVQRPLELGDDGELPTEELDAAEVMEMRFALPRTG